MNFLICLALATAFAWFGGKLLKKHATAFYIAATAIAVFIFLATEFAWARYFPDFVRTSIWPMLAKSSFATALFAVVMYTGVLKRGTEASNRLRAVRGELSIIASILTLGHNLSYGLTYFPALFVNPGSIGVNFLLATVCTVVMMAIMIPLFVTSFITVRKKMKAADWKKLQKLAYGFYALIYIHVLLINVPYAQMNREGYFMNIVVFSLVFLLYGALRIGKALEGKSAAVRKLPLVAALCIGLVVCGCSAPQAQDAETDAETAIAERQEEGVEEESTEEERQEEAVEESAEEDVEEEIVEESKEPVKEEVKPETKQETVKAETKTEVKQEAVKTEPAKTEETKEPAKTEVKEEVKTEVKQEVKEETKTEVKQEAKQEAPAPAASVYKDGTYEGKAFGYNANVSVAVTISGDKITNIKVLSHAEDEPYWTDCQKIIKNIIATNSVNVDTVAGATFTSDGIIGAVKNALASAKQ